MPITRPQASVLPFAFGAAAGLSPADSTTYYWAIHPGTNPTTSVSIFTWVAPRACIVRVVNGVYVVAGTLASAGNSTVRLYNTVSTATQDITTTLALTSVSNLFSKDDCSFALAIGDGLNLQWVTPAWATNPTVVFGTASILVEWL